MKVTLLLLAFFITIPGFWLSAENKAYLQDGNILIETPKGTRQLDYADEEERYIITDTPQKWTVHSQTTILNEALQTYRDKQAPLYEKNIWIVDEADGNHTIHVDYITKNKDETMIFSPDGEYAYYLETKDGKDTIYGLNLSNQETFFISIASEYQIITCTNNKSYLAVNQGTDSNIFVIYDLSGNEKKTLENAQGFSGIQHNFCLSVQ